MDYVKELRQLSRSCRDAMRETSDQRAKQQFAGIALSLALLAEKMAIEINETRREKLE